MRILVTGGTGLLGRNLLKLFETHNISVWAPKREELNLLYPTRLKDYLKGFEFDLLIHSGAATDVDLCEKDPIIAYNVNWLSTKELVEISENRGVPVIYISTDYVFDGEKERYNEEDQTNPLSVYGKSKLLGEKEVLDYELGFVLRTSWIFGKGGKTFFSRLPEIILNRGRITAVYDQTSSPTYVKALAITILEIVKDLKTFPPGVYHLAGQESTTPYDFALEMTKLMGKNSEIIPVSRDLVHFARRPKSSVLITSKIFHDLGIGVKSFREYLEDFLKEVL